MSTSESARCHACPGAGAIWGQSGKAASPTPWMDRMDEDGAQSKYVKLISAEGHEFIVDRRCATVSKTIDAMLAGNFAESRGEIKFPEISTHILEKVIQYLYYKIRYTNAACKVPDFAMDPEVALELLMAANFLDC